ncbi:MAG: hypothetical protein AAF639_28485, partial [Chloroflexota bacterium]
MAQQDTKSKTAKYIPHDRLLKEFFERFLAAFLLIFLPAKAARLKLDDIRFFKQELIVNFPGQALRITDIVAEIPLKESDEDAFETSDGHEKQGKKNKKRDEDAQAETEEEHTEFVIIHIDAEANRPWTIPHRMFAYYSLLRIIKEKPVLPIAFITRKGAVKPDDDDVTVQSYIESLWGQQHVNFQYY